MSNFNLAGQVDKLIASQAGQSPNTDKAFIVKARKKARAERKAKRKEDRATMFAGAVEAFAAGIQAEGERRAKLGLSGAGFAAAFGAGASEVIDFAKLQKARRKSAMVQKLGFTPADAEADAALIESLDALTTALGKQNQSVAPRPMPTDDADDPVPAAGATDPLEQQGPENEEDSLKVLQSITDMFAAAPPPPTAMHPVLKDLIDNPGMQPITGVSPASSANPKARMMGLTEESPGVFVDSTGQVVDLSNNPLDTDGDGKVSLEEARAKKGN
tara:strand:+ start:523 stop:1341 length:819 start_codon:yes stop_codon:yes gene_type:complete